MSLSKQEELCSKAFSQLKEDLPIDNHVYENFILGINFLKIDGNEIIFTYSSPLVNSFFNRDDNLKQKMSDYLSKYFNQSLVLKLISKDDASSTKKNSNTSKKESRFFTGNYLNKNQTFDNFVVGECNNEAVKAALLVSQSPGQTFNPLFIYSKSGLGKTHLLNAIGNYYKEKNPNKTPLYITTDSFVDEYVKYATNSNGESFRDFFNSIDILLIDDIQFLADKAKTSEMFFNIFNLLINSNKQIILTSDRKPSDLRGLEDRLVTRFNQGLTVSISSPDTKTSLEILKRKITQHGFDIKSYDEDGLLYLAETFSRNVRDLEGALNRLIFLSQSLNKTGLVTINDIKESVKVMAPQIDESTSLNEDELISVVCKYYNVSVNQIKSKDRSSNIVLARQISMYLCRTLLAKSYPQIGNIFSRDHSTVMAAVDKISREVKTNPQLSVALEEIKNKTKN